MIVSGFFPFSFSGNRICFYLNDDYLKFEFIYGISID
jgi:hypothetical protein